MGIRAISKSYTTDEDNNLQIDIFGYDDETTIFSVIDRESVINDKTFIWIFANK